MAPQVSYLRQKGWLLYPESVSQWLAGHKLPLREAITSQAFPGYTALVSWGQSSEGHNWELLAADLTAAGQWVHVPDKKDVGEVSTAPMTLLYVIFLI